MTNRNQRDQSSNPRRWSERYGVIEQLFVLPGHERRGVGHRLLDYAEGYAIAERAPALRIVVERDLADGLARLAESSQTARPAKVSRIRARKS